jgi:predicted transcriptional regulator
MSKPQPTEPSLFDEPDVEADELALREGEADAEAGRVVPHEEVAEWLATWGSPDAKPMPRSWLK